MKSSELKHNHRYYATNNGHRTIVKFLGRDGNSIRVLDQRTGEEEIWAGAHRIRGRCKPYDSIQALDRRDALRRFDNESQNHVDDLMQVVANDSMAVFVQSGQVDLSPLAYTTLAVFATIFSVLAGIMGAG